MVRIYKTLEFGRAARNAVWRSYQARAARKMLCWTLTREEFDVLIGQSCYYCRRPPTNIQCNGRNYGYLIYNGIDRLENKIGYTKRNAVSCCVICNRAKGTLSTEEFLNWIKDISSNSL